MSSDPEIGSRLQRHAAVDFHHEAQIGPPREPRWAGTQPEMTPARRRALAAKRAYTRAVKAGVLERVGDQTAFLAALKNAQPLLLVQAVPALAELTARPLRVFAALVIAHMAGHGSVALTHDQLAAALSTSVSTARRAIAELVKRGRLDIVPDHVPNDGRTDRLQAVLDKVPHSQRGNLYAIPDVVWTNLVRASWTSHEQPSGTVVPEEHVRAESSQRPAGDSPAGPAAIVRALCLLTPCEQVAPLLTPAAPDSSMSASRTIDCRTVVPDAAAVPSPPATRQAETRSVAQKAPDGGSFVDAIDGLDERYREVAALAALGNDFAAEFLGDLARDRERKARGLETQRRRELARRGELPVIGGDE